MRKRLNTIGRSVALVIDAPIRRQLGIGRNTIVELSTDGKCLIVEPLPPSTQLADRVLAVDSDVTFGREAQVILARLLDRGLTEEQFAHLGCGRLRTLAAWLNRPDVRDLSPQERLGLARLKVCYEKLEAGASWDEALEQAAQSSKSAGFFS